MGLADVVNIFDNKVYNEIEKFLNEKRERSNSNGTVGEYERDIRTFFKFIRNKDIEHLTIDDVQIPNDDLREYKNYLINELDNGLNTVSRKFSTLRSLYEYFYNYDLVDDKSIKSVNKIKITNNKDMVDHHGILTVNEVLQMAELVLNQEIKSNNKNNVEYLRKAKYFLLLFSLDTCLRKQAILNLTWKDFDVRDDSDEVTVMAIDKGGKQYRPKISKDFYNELLELKIDDGKVFKMSSVTIQNMMKWLIEEMEINKDRKIVFHSIRKCGVTYCWKSTGNIMQAKKAANHSNLNTTQIYLPDEDYGAMGAISSIGKLEDDELYKKVSHEDLLKGIESLIKDQKLLLNIKLNEIISNN